MVQLLRLNIPPVLEEELVDFLLARDFISGFQSLEVRGHGVGGAMSIDEQVVGRRKRIQFEVVLEDANVSGLLEQLSDAWPSSDVLYWVFPVAAHGQLDSAS